MPELSVAKVYDGEVVKHLDFDYTFEQVLKNVEVLGGLLKYGKQTDFVIDGNVSVSSGVVRSVIVSPLLCFGKSLSTPVYNSDISEALLVPASDSELERIDIVQVQSVIEPYEPVQRAIYNAQLEAAEYKIINTRRRLATKYMVKSGEIGSGVAPETDIGWVKLAEIIVPANSTEILPEHIKVVTTPTADEANTEWTTEPTRTVYLGGIDEIKAALRAEVNRATGTEGILQAALSAEKSRAETEENTKRKIWNKITIEGSPGTISAAWMLGKMGITDDKYRIFGKLVFYESLNSGTSVAVCDFILHKYETGDTSTSNFIPYNFSGVSNSWKAGNYNWTISLAGNSIAASFSASSVSRARIDIIWADSNDNTMF